MFQVVKVFVAAGGLLQLPAQEARQIMSVDLKTCMNAALRRLRAQYRRQPSGDAASSCLARLCNAAKCSSRSRGVKRAVSCDRRRSSVVGSMVGKIAGTAVPYKRDFSLRDLHRELQGVIDVSHLGRAKHGDSSREP